MGIYDYYNTRLSPQLEIMFQVDKYKKPNHFTFSNQSKYYNGQPWAVDWNREPYKTLARLGVL